MAGLVGHLCLLSMAPTARPGAPTGICSQAIRPAGRPRTRRHGGNRCRAGAAGWARVLAPHQRRRHGGAVPGREWVRPASTIAAGVLAAAALGKVGPVSGQVGQAFGLSPFALGATISLITLVGAVAGRPGRPVAAGPGPAPVAGRRAGGDGRRGRRHDRGPAQPGRHGRPADGGGGRVPADRGRGAKRPGPAGERRARPGRAGPVGGMHARLPGRQRRSRRARREPGRRGRTGSPRWPPRAPCWPVWCWFWPAASAGPPRPRRRPLTGAGSRSRHRCFWPAALVRCH